MIEELKLQFKRLPVTMSLLAVIIALFLFMQVRYLFFATSSRAVFEMGALLGVYMKADSSQWWRLFSSLFIHIGWEHFLLNSFALYILGRQMEPVMGAVRFFILYLLSGLMGSFAALIATPETLVAGASGALYGLSAMFAVLYYTARNPYIRQVGQMQVGFLVAGAVMSFLTPNISIAGHLGGAIGGALCAVFIPIRGEERIFPPLKRGLALGIYLALMVTGIWFGL